MEPLNEISIIINKIKQEDIFKFFNELFTPAEITVIERRWRILKMLYSGCTQREIAKELKVGLCKVTRGAKILKSHDSVTKKILEGVKNDKK